MKHSLSPVIPGRRAAASPESIRRSRGYGFRARELAPAPRNDGRVKLLGISSFALTIAMLAGQAGAEQSCDLYAALKRLPASFEEIASADLGKVEVFYLTDGKCTCDNTPAAYRTLGKPAPQNVNWSCRTATAAERRDH
jgi:hypothetical protein